MKNTTFFPFERNKYFYGKLLSVDDFELEQKYFNDKRRMINRFLCGAGIVAGMNVVGVDEQTISVETGCALDSFGREIVIDTPVIKKLSLLPGFDSCTDMHDNYVYLCVEYDEKDTNPVHNIAGGAGAAGTDQAEYSRTREGYRLYLVNQEPEDRNLSYRSLCEETVVLYTDQDISVRQVFPRFVQSGCDAQLRIEIENLSQQYISFSYNLGLTCLTAEGEQQLTVSFDEMLHEKTGSYCLTYRLKTAEVSGVECAAEVEENSFRLFVSKQPVEARAEGRSIARVSEGDVKSELLRSYHQSAMERILNRNDREKLYLAKIYMIKAGDTYMIARIEPAPFGQYVMGNELSAALNTMLISESVSRSASVGTGREGSGQSGTGGGAAAVQVRNGVCEFPLSIGAQKGQKLFSKEIFHGLGLGAVSIQLGVETEEGEILSDPSGIFTDKKVCAEAAACSNEAKGSFTIGIRLLESVPENRVRVRWTALRSAEEEKKEKVEKKIFIKPSILELGMRESYFLEAVCSNMPDKRIEWSVKDDGGYIDSNGHYTAPNAPGVYEVSARSVAYPEVKASIFAVVRDKNE